MSITNADQVCINCMREKADNGVCPFCGFDESTYEPSPHHLQPRSILGGKCLIGRVLGEGGFGITYMGWDLNLDLKLAIKEYYPTGFVTRTNTTTNTVTPYRGEKAEFFTAGRSRFINEAKTLAKFYTLPGIVSVRDFFLENGTAYIVMEFVEGETLKQRLARVGGKVEASEVFDLVRPLLRSLAEMHATGLIHRDISPDNIMITPEGNVKLIDFGAARDYLDSGNRSLSVMLKPGYAPEEQYFARGQQGPWTDIYALCATLYRAITGQTPPESVERLRRDELIAPSALGAHISPAQEAALLKGLAVTQEDRWQSIPELNQALYPVGVETLPPKKTAPFLNKKLKTERPRASLACFGTKLTQAFVTYMRTVFANFTSPKRLIPIGIAVGLVATLITVWISGGNKTNNANLSADSFDSATAQAELTPKSNRIFPLKMPSRIPASDQIELYYQALALIKKGNITEAMTCYDFSQKISADTYTGVLLGDGSLRISRKDKDEIQKLESIGNGIAITMGGDALLRDDGTVIWHEKENDWKDITSISGYDTHLLGLQANGSVVASTWLSSDQACMNVWDWNDIVAVAAGFDSSVGLKSDGSVVEVGKNEHGEDAANQWKNIAAISAGTWFIAGLKTDGTVITTAPERFDTSDWYDIIAISAGKDHLIRLRSDGSVVSVGSNAYAECVTHGWNNIVAVAAGTNFTIGLRADGTILATGNNEYLGYGIVDGLKLW